MLKKNTWANYGNLENSIFARSRCYIIWVQLLDNQIQCSYNNTSWLFAFVPYLYKKLKNGKNFRVKDIYLNPKQKSANHHKSIGILCLYRREYALLVFKA